MTLFEALAFIFVPKSVYCTLWLVDPLMGILGHAAKKYLFIW